MRKIIRPIVMAVTKRLRAYQAKRFISDEKGKSLLDIGCGDMFFIEGFKNLRARGIDRRYGQDAETYLPLVNDTYDYITMLAVIEHFNDASIILSECNRLLNQGGLLIMTTPFHKSEKFINMYMGSIDHEHYFVKSDFENMPGLELIHYSTFEFGLNQLIVMRKQ